MNVPKNMPENYKKITKLDLSNQKLKEIPKYVFELTNLRKLILHNNEISNIPSAIKQLAKLRTLDLSNNFISVMGCQLLKLPKLRILNLSYNQIVNFPGYIKNSAIRHLILSGNNLSSIELSSFKQLERLNLSNNVLKVFSLEGVYPTLKSIWLGNNPIERISLARDNVPSLRALYTYTYPSNINDVAKPYAELMSMKGNTIDVLWKGVRKNVQNEKYDITMNKVNNNKVFIVHGHDSFKTEVELFLRTIGMDPIILHKQADLGKTIIEKIETYSDVAFGIVLYTPDDEGRLKGNTEWSPRARQNVIFEHGFLIGKLGREHVCALLEKSVEKPGDLDGLVYVNMDEAEGWKLQLAKNMKVAGMNVDMNKAI